MVNPLDFIPKLSGFSPMPLGIMAPFMGYQSAALAYNFGLNYEFGKRVIKSMSNEKFNEIANDPILLNELTSRHHDVLLKAFINEVPKVDKIQDLIIKKMVELEFAKIKVMPELIAQIPKGFIEGLFALGGSGETTDELIRPPVGTPKRPERPPVTPFVPPKPDEPRPRRAHQFEKIGNLNPTQVANLKILVSKANVNRNAKARKIATNNLFIQKALAQGNKQTPSTIRVRSRLVAENRTLFSQMSTLLKSIQNWNRIINSYPSNF